MLDDMVLSVDPTIDSLPPLARQLLAQACAFCLTARLAHQTTANGSIDLLPVTCVNVGFAYELSCKAVLAARQSEERMLCQIGHDLVRGLRDAEAAGLSVTSETRKHVELLSPIFQDHTLRYLSFDVVELPADPITILQEHINAVGRLLLF